MSQTKYDVYEFLIKDKNELMKILAPGARLFLQLGPAFQQTKRERDAFNEAFEVYIKESLGILINNRFQLTLDQISDILDDEDLDDSIKEYFNQEEYINEPSKVRKDQ